MDSVVAATQSSSYATSQAASYTAVPGASPYAATQTVVTPAGAYAAPPAEQQYAQPALAQPGNEYTLMLSVISILICDCHG